MASVLPRLVLALTHAHDAWIVGGAANPENEQPRDFDIIVPFSKWQEACMLIPMDATVNHFGGWKCTSEGVEVDVWCGDIGWLMSKSHCKYAWHVASGNRWSRT